MSAAADFYSQTRSARRVLVIDPGALGDAVHLVPALWALRANYPSAELHLVSSPVGAEIHHLTGCLDRQWVLEQARERRSLVAQLRVLLALRRLRFDVSINFGDQDRNVIHAGIVRARHRLGCRAQRWHFWSRWCIRDWFNRRDPKLPEYEQRRQLLAAGGMNLESSPRWDLHVPETARRQAVTLVPEGAIHFSICASSPLKEWPLENWIAFAKRLLALYPQLQIVATGSRHSREEAQLRSLVAAVASNNLKPLNGLSIAELAAVLQRCQLHVGADSGVLHLAAALGRPTISLFRDYHDASAWMPMGAKHRVFSVPCVCVNRREPPCATANRAACLARLEVEPVATAVGELLQSPAPGVPRPQ